MITASVTANIITITGYETLVSGTAGLPQIQFAPDSSWDDLALTAVFSAGGKSYMVALGDSKTCTVPWEVLSAPGLIVRAGIFGVDGNGDVVRPTVCTELGKVKPGVNMDAGEPVPATPDIYQQVLALATAAEARAAEAEEDAAGAAESAETAAESAAGAVTAVSEHEASGTAHAALFAEVAAALTAAALRIDRLADSFVLIETITTASGASVITRTTEPGGAAYDFTEVLVCCLTAAGSANGNFDYSAYSNADMADSHMVGEHRAATNGISTITKYHRFRCCQSHGLYFWEGSDPSGGPYIVNMRGPAGPGPAYNPLTVPSVAVHTSIKALKLASGTDGVQIPAGTVVYIWARRRIA